MLTNGNNNYCEFAGEIVSYIYDEANVVEREEFSSHLAHCVACTDEFASISSTRYAVFEWRREEFDRLSTPKMFIPSADKVEGNSPIGLLAGLKELFAGSRWPVTALATVAFILGIGFVLIAYFDRPNEPIAANIVKPAMTDPVNAPGPAMPGSYANDLTAVTKEPAEIENRKAKAIPRKPKPDKRVMTVRDKPTQEVAVRRNEKPSLTKAPVLSNFEESEDTSLRLADLLGYAGVSN